jgi:hypothetical protein
LSLTAIGGVVNALEIGGLPRRVRGGGGLASTLEGGGLVLEAGGGLAAAVLQGAAGMGTLHTHSLGWPPPPHSRPTGAPQVAVTEAPEPLVKSAVALLVPQVPEPSL